MSQTDVVLILGSGPNAPLARGWPKSRFDRIVTINNAWRVREDWDDAIYPEDFPQDRRPQAFAATQRAVEADQFIPAQNAYGGIVFAGGTMAFTAGYWALHALRPRVLAFLGCDMVYPKTGPTHYYGTGTADPLREDITLRDLEAKSARLGLLAAQAGCACVNLSCDESRLVFDRATPRDLMQLPLVVPPEELSRVRAAETALGYDVPDGRYWQSTTLFDATALDRIDAAWRDLWERAIAHRPASVAA